MTMAPAASHMTQRLLAVLIAGLLVSSIAAAIVQQVSRPAVAAAVDRPVPAPTTVPTTAPPTAVTVARAARPVAAPTNEYAPEPITQIGTIEIPKIGVVSPIFHGITMRNIDLGPSHWPGTAMPGQPGNTVFMGHRVTHTHPFRDIDQLVPGDQVIFTVNGLRAVYVVTGHEIVRPSQTGIVTQTTTATGTIFACHPPHSAAFRYVVHLALSTQ